MSDLEEPGLEYLPAEVNQHDVGQPRKYDAVVGVDASARIAKTGEIVQEILNIGYAADIDPAVTRVRYDAIADLERRPARLQAPIDDLLRQSRSDPIIRDWTSTNIEEYEAELGVTQQRAVTYVPPAREQQYAPDADYQSAVLANTRVVPAATVDASASRLGADTARFQTELAIAQQAAVNQVRAQQQADAEAAERLAPEALAQYIARPRNATVRPSHR